MGARDHRLYRRLGQRNSGANARPRPLGVPQEAQGCPPLLARRRPGHVSLVGVHKGISEEAGAPQARPSRAPVDRKVVHEQGVHVLGLGRRLPP